MKAFVRDALRSLGAEVSEEERALNVRLPADAEGATATLIERLGPDDLKLVFDPADLAQGTQLVAPGSHVLHLLEELLSARGRRSYLVRPAEHRLTLKLLRAQASAARGRSLSLVDKTTAAGYDVFVVYRLSYRCRHREDAVETVRVRIRPGRPALVERAEVEPEVTEWEAKARKLAPEDTLHQALALADAEATARAREEGARLEAEARQSFRRDVQRLHSFYSTQIAEQRRKRRSDLATLRMEELEEERELRIRELVAAAQVHVHIEPLQLLCVEVPLQTARLLVKEKGAERPIPAEGRVGVYLDRSSGELRLDPCPACQSPFDGAALDACAQGHPVHQACLDACGRCQETVCRACQPSPCSSCDLTLCPSCAATCRTCAAAGCAEHEAPCAVCQTPGCGACLQDCAACREPVCEADRVPAGEGTRAAYCTRCATPCPGCETATPRERLTRCGTCGRRFCGTCHPAEASACSLCLSE